MTAYRAALNGRLFTPIGSILPGQLELPRHRVRAGSRRAGSFERQYWSPCKKSDLQSILVAARRYDLEGRQAGKRNGPLGGIALEILALLTNIIQYRTGRLEPSLAYLTSKLKRSRDAVVRGLAALRDHGFLDWIRRFEDTETDGQGPQRRQITNAYRLSMPERAARLVRLWTGRPAIPDDVLTAEIERKLDYSRQMKSITLTEYVTVTASPATNDDYSAFRAALLQAAGNIEKRRESAQRSENQTQTN